MRLFKLEIILLSFIAFAACKNNKSKNQAAVQKSASSLVDSIRIIKDKFFNADTILLTGHLGRVDSGDNSRVTNPAVIINGKLNDSIIKTRYIVKKGEIDSMLSNMLDTSSEYVPKKCGFNPHHAIILIKGKSLSYINICFDCQEFETSEDLKWLNKFDFNNWKNLEAFYVNRKVRYYPYKTQ